MGQKTAVFAGTFDPFTVGHADIVSRGLALFDSVVVAIGVNPNKKTYFTVQERLQQITRLYQGNERVRVVSYTGLTVDLLREIGATVLLRGVRSLLDYEYERHLADVNAHLGIDTVLLFTAQQYAHITSGTVRELLLFGHDVSSFLPAGLVL